MAIAQKDQTNRYIPWNRNHMTQLEKEKEKKVKQCTRRNPDLALSITRDTRFK